MVAHGSNRVVAEYGRNRPARKLFLVEGGDASDPSQVPPGALRACATSQPDNDGQRNSAGSHPASMWNGGANGNGTQWLTTKTMTKKAEQLELYQGLQQGQSQESLFDNFGSFLE